MGDRGPKSAEQEAVAALLKAMATRDRAAGTDAERLPPPPMGPGPQPAWEPHGRGWMQIGHNPRWYRLRKAKP